ncbi:hypothetical protein B296_00005858 [Ensete ventricosum]|uniref:Uncharacterized protein n=1 Tax=Ensete ventricosum TaxID=4639 RepID=A0A426YCS7_ENSVE|nr:hypothetical protein B296_00005858 [Ensete ventricosum]
MPWELTGSSLGLCQIYREDHWEHVGRLPKEDFETHHRECRRLPDCENHVVGAHWEFAEGDWELAGARPEFAERYSRDSSVTDNNVNKMFDEMLVFVRVLRFVYISCTVEAGLQ